jgi:hypothetical protein
MSLIEKGNSLAAQLIQPNWTYNRDPFGLGTSTTKYKCDHTTDIATFAARGTAHPDPSYSFLKANSYSVSWDALGIATVTVDYVGIPDSVNGGLMTNPNTSSANGLTAENITSHPNFFVVKPGYLGPIAGAAPYTQDVPDNYAPIVNGAPAFMGLNGSCFEKANGGRFIGFVRPDFPQYYGKTQYLAKTTTYSGVIYFTQIGSVQAILALLNTATATNSWGIFALLPAWAPVGVGEFGNNVNLLSQVNVEEFGALYKVSYEIRYAKAGWERDVYINIGAA